MSKEYKLDIFKVLNDLNREDMFIWDSLSEAEQKELSPLMLMRWMTSTQDKQQVYFTNELVNTLVFNLGSEHKELLLKMLACANSGMNQRYKWITNKAAKVKKPGVDVISEYYNMSTKKVLDVYDLFSQDDIMNMAEYLGYQKEDLNKLKKEFK